MPESNYVRRNLLRSFALILTVASQANTYSAAQGESTTIVADQIQKFTSDELRSLVAPIALYPDALLAQILPAAAYPIDIVTAYRYAQTAKDTASPPEHATWNSSVVALLHYPTVLKRMNDDISWTERLGVAVTYQMADVTETIQQVRLEAQAAGNLATNGKQIVTQDQNEITVVPADPRVIYVPTYQPEDIFVQHDSYDPFISFGIGFGTGLWLTNDFDWRYHRIGIYNDWYNGYWGHHFGSNYWRAPYRPIPSWYWKGGYRAAGATSNYGYRSGSYTSAGRNTGARPLAGPAIRPTAQPAASAPASASQRSSSAALSHAEGLGQNRQQVTREATRGESSRQSVQPVRTAPTQSQHYGPAQSQNVMRPSNGQQTRNESSRGAASRSSGGGARRR